MVEQILLGPGGATEDKQDDQIVILSNLLTELFPKLEENGTVNLSASSLAALENINATITGTIALDGPTLSALENINANVSGTVALDGSTLAALENINADVTGTVSLSAGTLAALETINAVVQNWPADFPNAAAQVTLGQILTELNQKLEAGQDVGLTAGTLAALENITATVSGTVALDAPTLAALENISATVTGTVALDAPTLAALETINVLGPLTDAQLRATAVDTLEKTGLVPKVYDYLSLSYTGENITGVVYKAGGAGGTTVATLTLTYTGDQITSVART